MKQDGLLPEDRMFVGKKMNNDVGVFINDNQGRPRIKIYIDRDNNPKIEFLDEKGSVVKYQ
jgi:putative heme iron utilization protein